MDKTKLAAAFNEWMRRFTEDPAQFSHEWESVAEFLKGKGTYGENAAAYLLKIMEEV